MINKIIYHFYPCIYDKIDVGRLPKDAEFYPKEKKATMPTRIFLTFAGILIYAIQRKSQALLRMVMEEEFDGV
jgi:hypothetical protein